METLQALKTFYENRDSFRFVLGETPMTDLTTVISTIIIYLVTIFALQEWMRERKRFELTAAVVIHNLLLSAFSVTVLIALGIEVWDVFVRSGYDIKTMFCDPSQIFVVGRPAWLFYLFFLSKFYELLDTVIIVLKKNPIIFLHVYHHCITILLLYVTLGNDVAVNWIATSANLLVHTPMYFYYALHAMGIDCWWKKYITKLQIVQFVLDLTGNSVGLYYHLQPQNHCSGPLWSWLFGQAVLFSFLVLFIAFYKNSYSKSPSTRPKKE